MTELQNCILRGFNALENPEQQHQILDVIYDALYHQSYLQVIGNRVIREKDSRINELVQENDYLRESVRELEDSIINKKNAQIYYNSLTGSERDAFRAEVREEVFYKQLRQQNKDYRKVVASLRRTITQLSVMLGRPLPALPDEPEEIG